jgi:hypothetical protein
MPIAFYLEDIEDYVLEKVELSFQEEEDDYEDDERSFQADYERLADRFNT